jgi:hypothetical protein
LDSSFALRFTVRSPTLSLHFPSVLILLDHYILWWIQS